MAHILLVEDDSDIMRINRTFLENAGYTVHCAESVQQAAFQLEECVPDLVLLDVMLPDGDGMDFCRILRQKTQAPVIFLTARDENDSVVMGFQSGGRFFFGRIQVQHGNFRFADGLVVKLVLTDDPVEDIRRS